MNRMLAAGLASVAGVAVLATVTLAHPASHPHIPAPHITVTGTARPPCGFIVVGADGNESDEGFC